MWNCLCRLGGMGYEGEAHWRLGGWGVAWVGGLGVFPCPKLYLSTYICHTVFNASDGLRQIERNICSQHSNAGFVHMGCIGLSS